MAGETNTTTNYEEIRRWVEAREGRPASVRGTGSGDDAGLLRIDFPGGAGEDQLEPITWEEFFEKFDEKKLAFLYQETTKDGGESRFVKFISQSQAGQPAAEQSPLQAVVEQARVVMEQVIAWLRRMLQVVRDWLTSLLVSLLEDAPKAAANSMPQQGMQALKPTAE